jgi:hypothetical protein
MTSVQKPSTLLSINEDGASAHIVNDERQPFGSRKIHFNEAGLEKFSGLIEEHRCNAIAISYNGVSEGKVKQLFKPDLGKVAHPESILELHIGEAGAFSPDFDFKLFEKFENVKAFVVQSVSMDGKLEGLFPKLEVLRIFDWKKNKIKHQPSLWPNLRGLQIVGFRGDLSPLTGWNIRSLFLDSANLAPFSSLRSFPELETLRADSLASDIDLSVLSDLHHLKQLSLRKPRRPPNTTGFASQSMEMMILEKIGHIDLENFPNLKIYGIDLGKKKRLDKWDGFDQYGDPFAAVHFRRYPFTD